MSNFQKYGTLAGTTDETSVASCRGAVTLSSHIMGGTGVVTWQFKGPDGVWRGIYGGTTGNTAQAFTNESHMVNVYFGGDVSVKGVLSGGSSADFDYQIIGSPLTGDG